MDVLAGGEIHDGVGTPLGGPAHFLHLFLDGGGDGAVADISVDLHKEVPTDDHGLQLGVVNIGRDNGAACSDLGADELWCDLRRYALREAAEDRRGVGAVWKLATSGVLFAQIVPYNVL